MSRMSGTPEVSFVMVLFRQKERAGTNGTGPISHCAVSETPRLKSLGVLQLDGAFLA